MNDKRVHELQRMVAGQAERMMKHLELLRDGVPHPDGVDIKPTWKLVKAGLICEILEEAKMAAVVGHIEELDHVMKDVKELSRLDY